MRTERDAASAVNAHHRKSRFSVHVHSIYRTGVGTGCTPNAGFLFDLHPAASTLTEGVRGACLNARSRITSKAKLSFEPGAHPAG
jgi:hypothetical protein